MERYHGEPLKKTHAIKYIYYLLKACDIPGGLPEAVNIYKYLSGQESAPVYDEDIIRYICLH